MALLPWDDNYDEKKQQEDLFNPTPVKQVASVQNGSWQPAASGADSAVATDGLESGQGGVFGTQPQQPAQQQPDSTPNYLMSEEHTQAEQQKQQRDAEIEAAREEQAQARQRAEAAAAVSQQFQEGKATDQNGQKIDVNALKADNGWKKYYQQAFDNEKKGMGFIDKLMDGGQASQRAEVIARNKYASELINKAYDENGNTIDQGSADYAKKVIAYNKALAEDGSTRAAALARAIGATKDNQDSGFFGRLKDAVNAEKQMNIGSTIFGVDDKQKTDITDLGRFGGSLGQGIFTMPVIGAKELYEAGVGHGTDAATGFEKDLTAGERVGRGVSGGLNVVTPFVGGSGKLLDSLTTKVLKDTATEAEKTLLKQLTAKIVLPAIEQGGIGAAQSGAEYFGNGGTLLDEKGNFDKEKLAQFAQQVGESGAASAAGGALLAGAGEGVSRFRNRNIPTLDAGELAALETNATNVGNEQAATAQAAAQPGEALQALENGDVTPVQAPVADGIATPDAPAVDTATPVAEGTATSQNADVTAPPTAAATPDLLTSDATATPADGVAQPTPTDVVPVRGAPAIDQPLPADTTPAAAAPIPGEVTPASQPVADGTVRPSPVVPAANAKVPQIPSEEIRQLNDAKAGASQAEEAALAQRIQELQNIPRGDRTEAQSAELNQKILAGFDKTRKQLGDESFYNDFIQQEADKPTRSADLAAEIIGKVENDGMSIKDALDDSLNADVPKSAPEVAQDSYASLSQAIRELEKSSNQPGLWKAIQDEMKGMNTQERVDYLNQAWNKMRESGVLAKDFINKQNGTTPEAPRTENALAAIPENATPVKAAAESSLPDGMTPVKQDSIPDMQTPTDGKLSPSEVAQRLMPKLADNSDVKARIADAAGMGKDTASPIEDILRDGNVNPKRAERITNHFNDLEEQVQRYNSLEEQNQKAYAEGGTDALDPEISKQRSRAAREMGQTTRRLMNEVKKMEGSRDHKVALMHGISDIIGTRNANVLTSMGLLERNLFQELTANVKLAAKNPIKMLRSTFGNGNIIKDTAKSELSHWADRPSLNPIDMVKYVVGNTYRTGMTPTTILANTRRGAIRDELTRWAFQELEGRKVGLNEAHKLAGTAGNEMEALVNTAAGVDNGMTNRKQALDAINAWKEYIRTGDDGAKAEFLRHVDEHTSLADQMIAGLGKEDQIRARGLKAMGQLIFPFVRTATNLTKNAVRQDLNPFAKSLLDEIKADQTAPVLNHINLIKSKMVDYGIMAGAVSLANSGALVYNDGDEVDKPKGWSLHIPGTDNYVPVRSTSLELPIAMAGTAYRMATDVGKGEHRDWKYYAGMITGSLPYIDQFNQTTGAVDSAMGAGNDSGDNGYAAKNYAVQTIKSFVPGSNNGVQPWLAGKEGNSLNAKTVYDKNFGTWLSNAIHKNYDPNFYNGLKDSRDNAGRVRTVDNQGVVSNKHINDASTAEFNQRVTDLVNYGRENGLGNNTQDMFNTYDTGKNNNFKSIQDSITFLDVPDGGKPDNAKKLEKNPKIANLSQQMRDGFFGDTGDELLTLDGQNLYSDVSVPNKDGSKNSRLPISMQSIKNAVAQTDLPADQRDRIKQISDQDTALYQQLKAKQITYDQYQAEKAKTGAEYVDILSSSKNYQKMLGLFDELDQTGFFKPDGLGSTKSGQTYLWNSLNALLGSKGATPAANYPDTSQFTPWGNRGTGRTANSGSNFDGMEGLKWTPVGRRQLAAVGTPKFTPFKAKVTLGNEIKKDRSQNYSDRTF